ncbi:hypothetical protein [Natranaerobius trueperi]|uniref:Uncharacterized protein n=1 Tax=Natranaerobius trueperi TaxID=759412 RepID=A0A226BVH9_9FIRM|nr:hypothetical protein [Natranaerobius trueperi]OWZ82891.1 hypothetical protein CDO51_11705 [Natranaerobius trueperi]
MNNKQEPDNRNNFEKQLEELEEWQENQYYPGHYIGTGRIIKFVKELNKYWLAPLIIGVICSSLVFVFINNILNLSLSSPEDTLELIRNIIFLSFFLVVGIYGIKSGIQRYLNR